MGFIFKLRLDLFSPKHTENTRSVQCSNIKWTQVGPHRPGQPNLIRVGIGHVNTGYHS